MKKLNGYGKCPFVLGTVDIDFTEFMFYLYLPIKLAGSCWNYDNLPSNLAFIRTLLDNVSVKEDDYVYVTAKNMWYESGGTYNREGWHSDGFMTDDINYIWSNGPSTEFITGDFNLSQDHQESLTELSWVGGSRPISSLPPKTLARLDQFVIHRPPPVTKSGMRAFIKISVSKEKYNLKGNSHNHSLDYDWEMWDRKATRNDPIYLTKEK